jgi:DNA-binding response OmpR family regulator
MKILVADDDPDIRELVGDLLDREGHLVIRAEDGQQALRAFFDHRPDVVVLDVAMPHLDGWQVLQRIRELSRTPVLMLTAHGQEMDKVRGLRAGADDYVTKPFGRQELLARIDVLGRRVAETDEAAPAFEVDQHGALVVDHAQRLAKVGEDELRLTPLEFRLLAAFSRHPQQVLSADQIIDHVWGDGFTAQDQVKLLVGRLRRKLAGHLADGAIETVRGFGYRFNPPG